MGARAKAIMPLAIVVGVLSFLWSEFALNFTFHWAADDALVPGNFHFVIWAAFIAAGLFFAAGGDNAAATKIIVASIFGTVAALITMAVAPEIAAVPDFWGIALMVGIMAFVLVMVLVAGDWYYVAGTFPAFAATFAQWQVTGLDNWVPEGAAQPYGWVFLSVLASMVAGVIFLGLLAAKLTAAITPKPAAAEA